MRAFARATRGAIGSCATRARRPNPARRSGGRAMLHQELPDPRQFVEPDRVHRRVYADAEIFELEMEHIFNKVWTYVGHESQVPKPGDYWTTIVGRQPMILVRHQDGSLQVLFNRCPH